MAAMRVAEQEIKLYLPLTISLSLYFLRINHSPIQKIIIYPGGVTS